MQVRLEGCTFNNNSAEHILVASHGDGYNEAGFYSDRNMEVYMPDSVMLHTSHTRKLSNAPEKMFLSSSDEWLADLLTVCTLNSSLWSALSCW